MSSAPSTHELVKELNRLFGLNGRLGDKLVELTAGVAEGFERVSVLTGYQTQEINTLKARQAVASMAQSISLVILVL